MPSACGPREVADPKEREESQPEATAQGSVAGQLVMVPAGQSQPTAHCVVQATPPVPGCVVPAGHRPQAVEDTAPGEGLKLPAGQGTGADSPGVGQ